MDRSEVVYLLTATASQDAYGVWVNSYDKRTVFAQVDSVTRTEFMEGGRNGLNPEFRITMFRYDYMGEREVEYNGLVYSVYRTYFSRTDTIELYVERKGGTNGVGETVGSS